MRELIVHTYTHAYMYIFTVANFVFNSSDRANYIIKIIIITCTNYLPSSSTLTVKYTFKFTYCTQQNGKHKYKSKYSN